MNKFVLSCVLSVAIAVPLHLKANFNSQLDVGVACDRDKCVEAHKVIPTGHDNEVCYLHAEGISADLAGECSGTKTCCKDGDGTVSGSKCAFGNCDRGAVSNDPKKCWRWVPEAPDHEKARCDAMYMPHKAGQVEAFHNPVMIANANPGSSIADETKTTCDYWYRDSGVMRSARTNNTEALTDWTDVPELPLTAESFKHVPNKFRTVQMNGCSMVVKWVPSSGGKWMVAHSASGQGIAPALQAERTEGVGAIRHQCMFPHTLLPKPDYGRTHFTWGQVSGDEFHMYVGSVEVKESMATSPEALMKIVEFTNGPSHRIWSEVIGLMGGELHHCKKVVFTKPA